MTKDQDFNMNCGVYEIRNIENNHCYIGSTVNFYSRWHAHKTALRHNKHHSQYLQRAWNKYGEDSFEFNVLLFCDKENNILYEQAYMDCNPAEYNVSPTACSSLGVKHTKEAKKNMSIAQTGSHASEETKKKLSIISKRAWKNNRIARSGENSHLFGKHHSEETRRKISDSMSGKNHWNYGNRHSEETRAKMSAAKQNMSEETKAKISASLKAYWNRRKEAQQGEVNYYGK